MTQVVVSKKGCRLDWDGDDRAVTGDVTVCIPLQGSLTVNFRQPTSRRSKWTTGEVATKPKGNGGDGVGYFFTGSKIQYEHGPSPCERVHLVASFVLFDEVEQTEEEGEDAGKSETDNPQDAGKSDTDKPKDAGTLQSEREKYKTFCRSVWKRYERTTPNKAGKRGTKGAKKPAGKRGKSKVKKPIRKTPACQRVYTEGTDPRVRRATDTDEDIKFLNARNDEAWRGIEDAQMRELWRKAADPENMPKCVRTMPAYGDALSAREHVKYQEAAYACARGQLSFSLILELFGSAGAKKQVYGKKSKKTSDREARTQGRRANLVTCNPKYSKAKLGRYIRILRSAYEDKTKEGKTEVKIQALDYAEWYWRSTYSANIDGKKMYALVDASVDASKTSSANVGEERGDDEERADDSEERGDDAERGDDEERGDDDDDNGDKDNGDDDNGAEGPGDDDNGAEGPRDVYPCRGRPKKIDFETSKTLLEMIDRCEAVNDPITAAEALSLITLIVAANHKDYDVALCPETGSFIGKPKDSDKPFETLVTTERWRTFKRWTKCRSTKLLNAGCKVAVRVPRSLSFVRAMIHREHVVKWGEDMLDAYEQMGFVEKISNTHCPKPGMGKFVWLFDETNYYSSLGNVRQRIGTGRRHMTVDLKDKSRHFTIGPWIAADGTMGPMQVIRSGVEYSDSVRRIVGLFFIYF